MHEFWTERPIAQIPQMPFEIRVQPQVFLPFHLQQHVCWVGLPVQAQADGVGDEEIVKVEFRVEDNHFIAHLGPGKVVHPGRVWGEEL